MDDMGFQLLLEKYGFGGIHHAVSDQPGGDTHQSIGGAAINTRIVEESAVGEFVVQVHGKGFLKFYIWV